MKRFEGKDLDMKIDAFLSKKYQKYPEITNKDEDEHKEIFTKRLLNSLATVRFQYR